ncbi:MAG TPA: NAD-dependent epimerase/dehydratase family protein [Polyangiaceae bacterium]|nr:NAD-dependent epimerase/dehydratase family protein [Polyangiaceae bacterium]
MRALVSGSTGFSGTFLVRALRARGFEVHAVSQRADAPGVERMDLTSSAAWAAALRAARPEHVFHLSGVAHAKNLADFAAHNTVAAAALLDAAAGAGGIPGALLFVGTAAEYGLVPEAHLPVDEEFSASPRTPYGATKYAQTQLALDAGRRGVRVIVARPSNIVGPGTPLHSAPGNFARQLREIELGRRAPVLKVGDLSASRDFIDVRDVVDAYLALATESSFTGLVNVSSGEPVAMRSILDRLISEFGIAVTVEQEASRVRPGEVSKFAASSARLKALIGERARTPLAASLRDLVAHERAVSV